MCFPKTDYIIYLYFENSDRKELMTNENEKGSLFILCHCCCDSLSWNGGFPRLPLLQVANNTRKSKPDASTATPSEIATFTALGPAAPIVPAGTVNGYTWNGGVYGGGNVSMIIVDDATAGHFTLNTWANHYSLLRTIGQNWGLGFLENASNPQVTTLTVPGEPKN